MQASLAHYSRRGLAIRLIMPVKIVQGSMAMSEVKSVPNLLADAGVLWVRGQGGPLIFPSDHEASISRAVSAKRLLAHSGFSLLGGGRGAGARAISFSSASGPTKQPP